MTPFTQVKSEEILVASRDGSIVKHEALTVREDHSALAFYPNGDSLMIAVGLHGSDNGFAYPAESQKHFDPRRLVENITQTAVHTQVEFEIDELRRAEKAGDPPGEIIARALPILRSTYPELILAAHNEKGTSTLVVNDLVVRAKDGDWSVVSGDRESEERDGAQAIGRAVGRTLAARMGMEYSAETNTVLPAEPAMGFAVAEPERGISR